MTVLHFFYFIPRYAYLYLFVYRSIYKYFLYSKYFRRMGQLSSRLPGADKNARREALKTFKGKVSSSKFFSQYSILTKAS